jgi:hypothetical protein
MVHDDDRTTNTNVGGSDDDDGDDCNTRADRASGEEGERGAAGGPTTATRLSSRLSSWRFRRGRPGEGSNSIDTKTQVNNDEDRDRRSSLISSSSSVTSIFNSFKRAATFPSSTAVNAEGVESSLATETPRQSGELQSYEHLMSEPSSKTSFIILQPAKEILTDDDDNKQKKQQQQKPKSSQPSQQDDCCNSNNIVVDQQIVPLLRTIWRRDIGIDLSYNEEMKQFDVVPVNNKDNNKNETQNERDDTVSSFSPQHVSSTSFSWPIELAKEILVPGKTVLESIDGINCQRRCSSVDDVWKTVDTSLRERTQTTITFAFSWGTNNSTIDANSGVDINTAEKQQEETKSDHPSLVNDETLESIKEAKVTAEDNIGEQVSENADTSTGNMSEQHDISSDESNTKKEGASEPSSKTASTHTSAFQPTSSTLQTPSSNSTMTNSGHTSSTKPKNSVHQVILIFQTNGEFGNGNSNSKSSVTDDHDVVEQNKSDHVDDDDTAYIELPREFVSTVKFPVVERKAQQKDRSSNRHRTSWDPAKSTTTTAAAAASQLVLDTIPRQHHWLSDSCFQGGDVVLCINTVPAVDLNVDDVDLIFHTMAMTHPFVSIKTYGPTARRRNRMESFRRAAVGVAGGTLVGVGSVLMVTPLHPVGHAMAIGGVGVLGMEFEGPRKAMESMKRSFHRQSSHNHKDERDIKQSSSLTTDDVGIDSSTSSSATTSTFVIDGINGSVIEKKESGTTVVSEPGMSSPTTRTTNMMDQNKADELDEVVKPKDHN